MSSDNRQYIASVAAIKSTFLCSGGPADVCEEVVGYLASTYVRSGLKGFSLLLKGWSKAVRAILSRNYLDTTHIGYCKKPRNCRYALRKCGFTELEILRVINTYDEIAGIPPFLLKMPYARILLELPEISDFKNVIPFANISRCAPESDEAGCTEALVKFFLSTSKIWRNKFDFTALSTRYAGLCSGPRVPKFSRWEASSHSSFDFSRSKGGKMGEIIERVVNDFIYRTIDDIVPTCPEHDLIDMFGHVALRRTDWEEGKPMFDCLYPQFSGSEPLDQRFGLFGCLWAIFDLRDRYPDEISSSGEFFALGTDVPVIRFSGVIESRVSALPEEGWKARVVTVTPLSIAMLQCILRHALDPFVRADPLIKIGLLSKVKLYDLLVEIHGSRVGITDGKPSLFLPSCESVDLTTATDSPYREGVETILRPFVKRVLMGRLDEFSDLVLDLALSPRDFDHALKPESWLHNCGIMMGEGLSGVYLNVMSGIVRWVVDDLEVEFPFYAGNSNDEADNFINEHHDWIQNWLDRTGENRLNSYSSQSGDDLIKFNRHRMGYESRYLKLMYRILGLIPSESTFYSSEFMGTFTEEFCIKNALTNGWIFIDCIKPRLFLPLSSEGLDSIISRIRQISGTLRYSSTDIDRVYNTCDAVDVLLNTHPVLRDRIERYGITKCLPGFLGGLDHPSQFLPEVEDFIPEVDKEYIRILSTCTEEEFLNVKYHWVFEDLTEGTANAVRITMRKIYTYFLSLEDCSAVDGIIPLQTYLESDIVDRSQFVGYANYSRELARVKSDFGLADLDDIISSYFSAYRFKLTLHGEVVPESNPMIKLRNRRQFLISQSKSIPDFPGDFTWGQVSSLSWRFRTSFKGKVTQKAEFLESLGLDEIGRAHV